MGTPEQTPEHEGERYLRLLGLSHLADVEIVVGDRTLQTRDFLDICGDHARPLLDNFGSLPPEDPRYESTRAALQSVISQFVEQPSKT
jgi:hypothetical protein